MTRPRFSIRLALTLLLGWQAIAPFAHLAQHARAHQHCLTTNQETCDGAVAIVTSHSVTHACATCQWLTGNPGLSGALHVSAGSDQTLIPAPLDQNAASSYPAFDFNVAVARGPPVFSLAAI